ncbi:hypothetical protein HY441_01775 [Candidatus Microgenomates bacterium]|nr:hypothetical protein [Candidatus Microgenomates bacterium]
MALAAEEELVGKSHKLAVAAHPQPAVGTFVVEMQLDTGWQQFGWLTAGLDMRAELDWIGPPLAAWARLDSLAPAPSPVALA